jgi:hypothetical protein
MVILIDAGIKTPKFTVVRDVLKIVTVSVETWIMSGEIICRAVIYSSNTAIIKYAASVEEINSLMFRKKMFLGLQAGLGKPVQMT